MTIKNFIQDFTSKTKTKIIDLATSELSNENKKLCLDHTITNYVEDFINKTSINFIFKWMIKKYLIPNISILTQSIFDLLKAKVKELNT